MDDLNLKDDWPEIKESFRKHFEKAQIEIEKDKILYKAGGEHLEIEKSGKASGSMPLHSTKLSEVKTVEFDDSEIKLKAKDSEYIFRR